jgi:hypothetical protein
MQGGIDSMGRDCADRGGMTAPRRVWRRRTAGWRAPENTVSVTRWRRDNPGPWGNPFLEEEHGRERAVELFRDYALKRLAEEPRWLEPLRGKNLMCYCKLDGRLCHADVLLDLANREPLSGGP